LGLGTQQEMCLVYFVYYPRLPAQNESCHTANFSGVDNNYNWTDTVSFCASDDPAPDFQPMQATPYQAPACIHQNTTLNYTNVSIDDLSNYQRSQYLDNENKYKLYWTVDKENGIISGAVEVETTGWVGFGISSYGMIGADVFIAWVKDGAVYLGDRFAVAHSLPPKDASQDYFNVFGAEVTDGESMAYKGWNVQMSVILASMFLGVLAAF